MARKMTKERLLDVAESLFGQEGYRRTSLRRITAAAGVNLAAVNYHFGSKEALLDAAFDRRLRPINEERMRAFDEIRKRAFVSGMKPSTEEVLRTFIAPVLKFRRSGKGADNFSLLVGRALTAPDVAVRTIFVRHMKPVFQTCFNLLCESLPGVEPELVFMRFNFALGAMSRGMCLTEDAMFLPEGISLKGLESDMPSQIISFAKAGLEGP